MADDDEVDTEFTEEQQQELDEAAQADEADDTAPDDEGDTGQLGDAGKRALDAMKRDRNKARDELRQLQQELKRYQDKDKSESERLQEAAETAKSRAQGAETQFKALQVALDRAPEHATLTQVRAVAKRVRGDDDDALETDADELFELLAPGKPARVSNKPAAKLRGGSDPEEEPEETDPEKLAKLIRRS